MNVYLKQTSEYINKIGFYQEVVEYVCVCTMQLAGLFWVKCCKIRTDSRHTLLQKYTHTLRFSHSKHGCVIVNADMFFAI